MIDENIKEMEEYAEEHSVPIMNKRGMNFLCKFIEKNEIKTILEIGTAIGYSAIRMALVNKNIHIVSIERDQERYIEAVKNIKKFKLDKRITLILGDALDLNVDLTDKFDMLFIDAAKAQSQKFFELFERNLTKDGYIITDNMYFHGLVNKNEKEIESRNVRGIVRKIKDYITFLKNNENYETVIHDIGDGIAVSKKKER